MFFNGKKIKNIANQQGVTLLELLVSVGIFSVILLTTTQIFQMVISSQRLSVASQDMQESIRYTFEKMSKEIRMAGRDESLSCASAGKIYKVSSDESEIFFVNYHGECVRYFLSGGRLSRQENSGEAQYMTPASLNISSLKFRVTGDDSEEQALVSVSFEMVSDAPGVQMSPMLVETSISSRFYE